MGAYRSGVLLSVTVTLDLCWRVDQIGVETSKLEYVDSDRGIIGIMDSHGDTCR